MSLQQRWNWLHKPARLFYKRASRWCVSSWDWIDFTNQQDYLKKGMKVIFLQQRWNWLHQPARLFTKGHVGDVSPAEIELTSPTSKTIYKRHKGAVSPFDIELTLSTSKIIYKGNEGDVSQAEIILTSSTSKTIYKRAWRWCLSSWNWTDFTKKLHYLQRAWR